MTGPKFSRLLRFRNPGGEIFYGEVDQKDPTIDTLIGTLVRVYRGLAPWAAELALTNAKEQVAEVKTPFTIFIVNAKAFHRC